MIEPSTRLKYSNHGFGLLGLAIEAITGEPYRDWIAREIVDACGLRETSPDMPLAKPVPSTKAVPFARGHTPRRPLGRRLVIPGDNPAHAIASAAGFVSTAADVARFFAQLAPNAKRSVLSAAQPPGDDPKTLAQSGFKPGRLLRPGHHERQHRRLGLVRP